jgi:hypothetical protein
MSKKTDHIYLNTRNEIFADCEVDKRNKLYVTPQKIIWTSNIENGIVENSEVLLEKSSNQISLVPTNPCILKNHGVQASVLLDYGCEIHGGILLLAWKASKKEGVKVRIRFGESAMEAMSEVGGTDNATNDHANRDLIVNIGTMSMNPIGETGFRFVRIDLLEVDTELELKAVNAILVYKDIPYIGSFSCNDPLLNRIWDTGAYTVHLNMQNYIWDGIKRDRLIWAGDLHPEIKTIQAVFGYDDSVPRSLDFVRDETPLPGWMNGFPAYSMWWIIIQHDWFMNSGNLEYLEMQKDYLIGLYKQLSLTIDENGKDNTPEVRFVDWPSSQDETIVDAGLQALHTLATEKLRTIFSIFNESELVRQCDEDLEKIKAYKADYKASKQAAALLVLAGLENPDTVNEKLLQVGGSKGMSTFMGYYVLTARAMAGDIKGSLDCIREYWGGMLSLGATTFWEDFDIEWLKDAAPIDQLITEEGEINVHATYGRYCYLGYRHSLCHGWASGATPWLTENILGVKILEPGCKKLQITPNLGDLEWAKGTYPTPFGVVSISLKKLEDGTIETIVEAPEEITVIHE